MSATCLSAQGMSTDLRQRTTCCHALQDKVWVDDPDRVPWEIYTVLADVEEGSATEASVGDGCAGPGPQAHQRRHTAADVGSENTL